MSEYAATPPSFDGPRTALLAALLDTLLPPRGETPGGGDEVLVAQVLADATDGPLGVALGTVLGLLSPDFASGTADEREAAFAAIEEQDPASAAAVVNLAYTAYYSDSRVLRTLEDTAGYLALPPQPRGYELPPSSFDSLLHPDRELLPLWRIR